MYECESHHDRCVKNVLSGNRGFSHDITAAKSCKSRYSQSPCWIFFFALSGIGKSHKICSHSLLLNLHKAKLHHSNNVINIYSLTASLTCSNKISKKLKHILLFFLGFSYTVPRKKYPTWRWNEVRTVCTASWKPSRTFQNKICWVYSFKCLNWNDLCFHCPLQCRFCYFFFKF